MQDRIEITESQVVEALLQVLNKPEHAHGFLTRDLVPVTGKQPQAIREGLRVLIERGRVVPAHVMRANVRGEMVAQRGYRWVGEPSASYDAETPVGGAG